VLRQPLSEIDAAPEIDPLDALAAMLSVRRSMIEVSADLKSLLLGLINSGPQRRAVLCTQLDELTSSLVSYSEQIQFLSHRYRDGQN
jgi:hypothetical protein